MKYSLRPVKYLLAVAEQVLNHIRFFEVILLGFLSFLITRCNWILSCSLIYFVFICQKKVSEDTKSSEATERQKV